MTGVHVGALCLRVRNAKVGEMRQMTLFIGGRIVRIDLLQRMRFGDISRTVLVLQAFAVEETRL